MPAPELRATVVLNGRRMMELSSRLQPLVRKRGVAVHVAQPPTLDGAVTAEEYGGAPANRDFVDFKGRSLPIHPCRFVVAYDDRALYVGVVADESEPGGLQNRPWPRDGEIWRDDYLDLFVDATFDKSTYHQFASNIRGDQYDAVGGPDRGTWGEVGWNATWQSAGRIGDGQFSMEFVIPFEALGVAAPEPGETWGLNVCRGRWPHGKVSGSMERTAWSIPYGTFHEPANFGQITFK